MKKMILALPVCLLFAYCSSSRKAVNISPGISNVVIYEEGEKLPVTQANNVTHGPKDWGYTTSRDSALNGLWVLQGIRLVDGTWSATTDWYPEPVDTAAKSEMNEDTNLQMSEAKSEKELNNINSNEVTQEMMEENAQPEQKAYAYWQRIPQVDLHTGNLVFIGNTGCNSMSGTFNFNTSQIEFDSDITTSKMDCNEYNELAFLDALRRVNNYTLNGTMLELRQDDTILLSFARREK